MGYNIIFDNIAYINTDAIVNIINEDEELNTSVCGYILLKAASEELEKKVKENINKEPGTLFITDGYQLRANYIYNIVIPYKEIDDDSNSLLSDTFLKVLKASIENKIRTLAIYIKHDNLNGYTSSQVYNSLVNACKKIFNNDDNDPLLDIAICVEAKAHALWDSERKFNKSFRVESTKATFYASDEYIKPVHKIEKDRTIEIKIKNYKNIQKCQKIMSMFKIDDAVLPAIKLEYPFDFVDQYLNNKNLTDQVFNEGFLDRRRKYQLRNSKNINKLDAYRIIYLTKMDVSNAILFLMYCGYTFNPSDKVDLFFIDYLLGKYKKMSFIEFTIYTHEKIGVNFFFGGKKDVE